MRVEVELVGVDELAQPSFGQQALVDRAEPPFEGGVDRDPERHGLPVHRSAGRDHEVRVGDQRLRVYRSLRHHEAGDARESRALGVDARQHHRLRPRLRGGCAQALEHAREEVVVEAVVERHLGRRAHDEDGAGAVEPQLIEDRRVGLEVGQVVLLLEALEAAQLGARAVAPQALDRDRLGHDHRARQAAVDLMLHCRPLVVEHRGARHTHDPRGHAHVVGAVAERDVEAA